MPFKKGPKYAFVVDGECEQWYIAMLKQYEGLKSRTEPKLACQRSIEKQYQDVCEFASNYEKVFWIIDLDVVIKETRESTRGETEIQKLKKCRDEARKQFENVVTIINTPCLEFWFLLHASFTDKYYDSYKEIKKDIKKVKGLESYEKTEKYYKKKDNDIYKRLKPYLSVAINNAKKFHEIDFNNYKIGLSQMNRLFEEIEELKHVGNL
jgi:hypothetical protein